MVLGGDTLSPSVASTLLQGRHMIAGLNALGLDLATFGNHEFDFGPTVLAERMRESKFAWLSANVLDRSDGRPFGGAQREVMLTLAGVRVGVFGLTTRRGREELQPGAGRRGARADRRGPRGEPRSAAARRAGRSSPSRTWTCARTARWPSAPTWT